MAKKTLRKRRLALVLDNAVIAGKRSARPIVYGYTFPSRPDVMKIGYSSRGVERILEQTTGFPESPLVAFVIHHPNAAEIEKRLHESLASRQVQDTIGVEWFNVSFDQVVQVSPELRRALGRQRWKSLWRWCLVALMALCGAVLAPVATDAVEGAWMGRQWVWSYLERIATLDGEAWAWVWQRLWMSLQEGGGWLSRVFLAAPVLVGLWAVMWRR